MKSNTKIQELWRYLKIRDDETLVIPSHSRDEKTDKYHVARMRGGVLEVTVEEGMPEPASIMPFRIVKQIDKSGKLVIPSVKQLIDDRKKDY